MRLRKPLSLFFLLIMGFSVAAQETGEKGEEWYPRIRWAPVAGARGYLVEVQPALSDALVKSETVEEASYLLELPPGKYRIRITTLNKVLRKELSTPWLEFAVLQAVRPSLAGLVPPSIFLGEWQTFTVRGAGLSKDTAVYLRSEVTGAVVRPSRTKVLSITEMEIVVDDALEPGSYTVLARNPPALTAVRQGGLVVILPPVPELPLIGAPPPEAAAAEPTAATAPAVAGLPSAAALAAELDLSEAAAERVAAAGASASAPPAVEADSPGATAPTESPRTKGPRLPLTVGVGYTPSILLGSWSDTLAASFLGGEVYLVLPFSPRLGGAAEIDYVQYESDPGVGKVSGSLRIASAALGLYADLVNPVRIRIRALGGWGYSMAETDAEISGGGTEDEQSGDFFAQCGAALVFPVFTRFALEAGCDFRSIFYIDEILFSLRPVVRFGVKL